MAKAENWKGSLGGLVELDVTYTLLFLSLQSFLRDVIASPFPFKLFTK